MTMGYRMLGFNPLGTTPAVNYGTNPQNNSVNNNNGTDTVVTSKSKSRKKKEAAKTLGTIALVAGTAVLTYLGRGKIQNALSSHKFNTEAFSTNIKSAGSSAWKAIKEIGKAFKKTV